MIEQKCKCENPTFYTTRSIQVDVELDKEGEHIRDISFGDYHDHLGENIIRCKKCHAEALISYESE